MKKAFLQRRPLAEARALLLEGLAPAGSERIEVSDAAGRIAAEDVFARHAAPHYRASAMDGIAVRAADTHAAAEAPLLLRALAPDESAPPEGEACCVPVDTGSLLPAWTDAVIRIEDVTAADGGWRIKSPVPPGRDLRQAGEDIDEGVLVVAAGARIRAADIGALLSTGTTSLAVRLRPRVGILATGGEVVEPGAAARPGQVIESNSRVIAALVEEWGGDAHRLGIVRDEEAAIAAAIADAAARFDAVCVIAGSSAGRKDFTIGALSSAGELLVHGVDISPGRPVAIAKLCKPPREGAANATTPAIAVPGYPVSAIVVCELLLKPLVAALLGSFAPARRTLAARIARKIPSRLGMEEFRRVCLARQGDDDYVVAALPAGAGSISTVTGAHGWLRIASGVEGLDADARCEVELLTTRDEVDAALVLAGHPTPASARLSALLRRSDARARVLHLRLVGLDALLAVERGEAHAAELLPPGGSADAASALGDAGLEMLALAGLGDFAVRAASAGARRLSSLLAT